MKRWEPIAYPGPDNGFGAATHRNFNQGTGARGSWLDAGGYQQLIDELAYLIEQAGLTLDEADSEQVYKAIRAIPTKGGLLNTQVFQTAGTFTYTPTVGTRYVEVEVQAGGGGGASTPATGAAETSSAGGGGSGAYARKVITAAFAGVTITVGAAGAGGAAITAGATGGTGGSSSFGALVSALGGTGGLPAGPSGTSFRAIGGNGGAAGVSGDINIPGLTGTVYAIISQIGIPTQRAAGMFGGGAGSGGDGSSSPPSTGALAGQAGRAGLVIVREYA